MMMTRRLLILTLTATVFAVSCMQQTAPPDTRAADEAAIRAADAAWAKAGATKDANAHLAYYTSDAVLLPPNEPPATGAEAVRKVITDLYALPGMSVKWQPTKVEVAKSGDLGYSQGTYELTVNDPSGKPVMDHGKYVEIWRKQPDGSWKCAVDTFNSDVPAAPPPSAPPAANAK
jgi:uncharacterized protein (TIGR02246 family)